MLVLLFAASTLHAQSPSPGVPASPPAPPRPASTANDVAFPVAHAKPRPHPARPDLPLFNFDTIVLDPAHGGADEGAKISNNTVEKDVNLAFANLLKDLLAARGFNVVMTRSSDTIVPKAPPPALDESGDPIPQPAPRPVEITLDQRVEIANRSRAVACILIHAANGGHGVHLFTSSLAQAAEYGSATDQIRPIQPWDTAQSNSITDSVLLASDLSTALNNIRIPLVLGRASVRPIDSMTCPALTLELAPLAEGDGQTPASDAGYQQRVAEAVAAALVFWRGHAESLSAAAQAAKAAQTPAEIAAPAAKKPRPKAVTPPVEVPDDPGTGLHKPAPIVRRPPPDTTPAGPPPDGGR